MAAPVLQFKRGAFSNLPGLRAGEPGFTTDRYDLYVGLTSETATNKFVGSARFWNVETASTGSAVNLVESSSSGNNYISLASPASLAGIVTYFLPGTQGAVSSVLTNDGSGNLTWASGSANPVFTGIATFNTSWVDINSDVDISGITTVTNTTDNTLGNANTGAFQIDGGLGVNKNVTVGGNLNVQGYSEFVGVVTFKGGTINLGDSNTDDIVVAGEFASSLVPTDDATYDIGGDAAKQWRHANFAGIGTFDGGLDIGGEATFASATVEDLTSGRVVLAGAGGALTDDGSLTFSDATGLVVGNSGINVTGVSTFSADVVVGDSISITNDASVGSALTVTGAVDFNGGLDVSGAETVLSSATVSDLTSGRVVLAGASGALQDSGNLTFDGSTLTVTGDVSVTDSIAVTKDVTVGSALTVTGAVDFNGGADIAGHTELDQLRISGVSTFVGAAEFQSNASFGDNDELRFGASNDLKIVHSASGAPFDRNRIISSVTSPNILGLAIESAGSTIAFTKGDVVFGGGETIAAFIPDGAVELYHDNSKKFETTGYGATVFGTLQSQQINVSGVSTFTGAIDANGGADISGGETTLSSATVSDLTSGRVVLAGTAGALQDSGNLTFNGTTLTVTGDAAIDNVTINGNTVSTSSGGLTLDSNGGTVTVADDLTVNGSFTVLGSQSIVNTETLKVEDSLIEIGLVNSGGSLVPPTSDANIDVGVIFHYFSGSAKKAALYWDDSVGRVVVGDDVSETTSVMTASTYAGFEIGSLWVNDCAGQSQVINCSGTTRTLENITIDGGSF